MNKTWQDNSNIVHTGNLLLSKDGFDVIECDHCGLKHVIPLVDQSVQEEFYTEQFYQKEIDHYIKSHQTDFEWWSIEHNEKFEFFEKHFGGTAQRKILDIGSGPGFFLKVATERGWNAVGIEPGKPAFEFSKNNLHLTVFNEFFSRSNYSSFGIFNVVHLNNVLEHVVNPVDIVSMVKEILVPNGLICISSPNDFNLLQQMAVEELGKDYWWVVPKHHINYFNLKSLKGIFSKIGFRTIFESTSFPLELFLFMGDDYIGNSSIGRTIHQRRMNLEKHFQKWDNNKLKRRIYNKFSEMGIGRELTIIGSKQDNG